MGSKIQFTLERVKELLFIAKRNGIMHSWADGAEAEIHRLQDIMDSIKNKEEK